VLDLIHINVKETYAVERGPGWIGDLPFRRDRAYIQLDDLRKTPSRDCIAEARVSDSEVDGNYFFYEVSDPVKWLSDPVENARAWARFLIYVRTERTTKGKAHQRHIFITYDMLWRLYRDRQEDMPYIRGLEGNIVYECLECKKETRVAPISGSRLGQDPCPFRPGSHRWWRRYLYG
jgi:hypothetical protein